MKCYIEHELAGRMRIHVDCFAMSLDEADVLEYNLRALPGIQKVSVHERTANATICYDPETLSRADLVAFLGGLALGSEEALAKLPERTGRRLQREYTDKLVSLVLWRLAQRVFLPYRWRQVITGIRSVKYIKEGAGLILKGRVEVPVLDATAIACAMLQGDFDTASSVMFLLRVGETLEEWTHKKSVDDLMRAMALQVDKVWIRRDGTEQLVSLDEVQKGDIAVVRMGSLIPLDGKVVEGECAVNQASMTGESLPVHKKPGSYVYSGTVVEEGELVYEIDKVTGEGRYDRIVTMIEESEKLKSAVEDKASHLADAIVPYHLATTALVYLVTGNVTKAMALLMVDFSCALKLAIPISVISAMRDAGTMNMTVKGGKVMEQVAEADTIVFDKTGTLTHATPTVAKVIAFDSEDENEMLRLAACLEEHYPHSVAGAVVQEAKKRGLNHEERHSKVEYVVAHGIASSIDGQKVIIGSHHFLFEDEGCTMSREQEEILAEIPDQYSVLYMAMAGKLVAAICIEDPVREEAKEVVTRLHDLGFANIIMMTGDSEKTAKAVAEYVGVDEYHSEVLPEDKAALIKEKREQGHKVIMIGDGINDTPALSEADAGIAIATGAAIAKEIADITITAQDLYGLVDLRLLCTGLMKRIDKTYRSIMTFNAGLMALGVFGILPPATSALAHNAGTILISLEDMTPLLLPAP